MKKILKLVFLIIGISFVSSCLRKEPLNLTYRDYTPENLQDGWIISSPEEEDMDSALINNLFLQSYREDYYPTLKALLIVRNGKLVAESYLKDDKDIFQLNNVMSAAKGITSILAGIALEKGLIESIDDPVFKYLPDYFDTVSLKREITIRQVLTMQTGLDFDNDIHASELINYDGSSLEYILHKNLVFDPGTSWFYGNGNPHLISGIIQEQSGKKLAEFAADNLFAPLGITEYLWESLKDGSSYGAQGLWLTARDMARIGWLMASQGEWKGERIVSSEWINQATTRQTEFQDYGYYWYPVDGVAYYAEGHGGQIIFAYPEKKLVVVIVAQPYAKAYNISKGFEELFSLIIASLKNDNPKRIFNN